MISGRTLAVSLAAALALAAGVWTALRLQPAVPAALQSGVMLPEPRAIAPFSLSDQDGRTFANAQLQGHWSLLFAGFTHCPDVCPTTLGTLKLVVQKLGARAPAVLFLSVDPERDTPAVLQPYVRYFGPWLTGLTASPGQLEPLCQNLGVAFIKAPGSQPGEYTMDHSSALVLIDPQGRVAGYFPPPHKLDTLAADLTRILAS